MFYLLEKHISLSPTERTSGELSSALEKLFLYAQVNHLQKSGEVLFDWEDKFIQIEVQPGVFQAAYSKNDEFQFGKLLSQMAALSQDEIDEAYRTVHQAAEGEVGLSESGAGQSSESSLAQGLPTTQAPPSQRIGSLLVAAHLISPHMIGTVLRTQVMERTLRVLSLGKLTYTFEPKDMPPSPQQAYPYLNSTVHMDEVIFQGLLWRTPIKTVNEVIDYFAAYQPVLELDANFQFPERLSVICRLEPHVMEKEYFAPVRNRAVSLTEWTQSRPKQQAFMLRFVAAFLLTHLDMWKATRHDPTAA